MESIIKPTLTTWTIYLTRPKQLFKVEIKSNMLIFLKELSSTEEVISTMSFSGKILFQSLKEEEFFQQKDQIFILLFQEILDQLKNSLLILMQIPQQCKDLDGDG